MRPEQGSVSDLNHENPQVLRLRKATEGKTRSPMPFCYALVERDDQWPLRNVERERRILL